MIQSIMGNEMVYEIAKCVVTALVLSLCIPVFGFLMSGVLKLLYAVISSVLGNRITYFIFNRVTFIGVFHHELSHALLAVLTGAHVTEIVFFKPEGDQLGHVSYTTRGNLIMRSIQQTFTSVAPVVCGAISSSGLICLILSQRLEWWAVVCVSYVLVSIVIHMTMSSQDFKVMWKGYPVVFLIILFLVWILRMTQVIQF